MEEKQGEGEGWRRLEKAGEGSRGVVKGGAGWTRMEEKALAAGILPVEICCRHTGADPLMDDETLHGDPAAAHKGAWRAGRPDSLDGEAWARHGVGV